MKKLCVLLVLLAVAGCASNKATATYSVAVACNSSANALDQLTPLKAANKLSAAEIKSVDTANSLVDPVCMTGVVPTDQTSAANLVLQEVQVILAIAGVHL